MGLDAKRAGAAKGEATSLVIFLHGYGANGSDLLSLAEPLAPHLPDTAFLSPDAPEVCAGVPFGFQWFAIPWIDGSSQDESEAGMRRAAEDLDAWLDEVMQDEGIAPSRTILLGFSQGTMMALQVAPRRSPPFAGIVGFSGRLLDPEALEDEMVSRPPILLIHGDADDVVPIEAMPEAGNALSALGFDVYAHIMKGTGHGIAPDGLSVALAFMRERFGMMPARG